MATVRSWGTPNYPDPQQQMQQADIYRQQTEAASQARVQQQQQQQAANNQLNAQRTAGDLAHQMLQTRDDYQYGSDGTNFQISTGGAAGGASAAAKRATSGFSVGGGVYPNVTDALALLKQNTGPQPAKVPAPAANSTLMSESFGQAKDIAGRQGNKALEALRNEMTRRGISDSGIAMEGEANILGNVARGTSQATYNAALADNAREWDARQLGYQGGIQQRGQDVSMYENDLDRVLRMILQLY